MTDRDDLQYRMKHLYTTGVPLPFECVAARQIEDRETRRVESALHTAFGLHRVNASREFFQIDPEQVQPILAVLPGRDMAPQPPEQDAGNQDADQATATEYKRRQAKPKRLSSGADAGTTHTSRIFHQSKPLHPPVRSLAL